MKFRRLTKTRRQCKTALFAYKKVHVCVCSWLNGFCSMLGSRKGVFSVFSQTRESLHLREPPSSMCRRQRGEITNWGYCNSCTFSIPHAWIAFDKTTLKKLVLNNSAYHYMSHVSVQSESINWALQGNSIIMFYKEMLRRSGQNTHTVFLTAQKIYCKDFKLPKQLTLIQSLYHVINKCNGLHKCRKEPDKKNNLYTRYVQ